MGYRVDTGTVRPAATSFSFDGESLLAYPGETIAAALLATGIRSFRRDTQQRPRGPYCNMGTCFECIVDVKMPRTPAASDQSSDAWRRVRACLTPVTTGLEARTAQTASVIDQST